LAATASRPTTALDDFAEPKGELDQMPDTLTSNSPIITAYRDATPGSAERAVRAAEMFPSGITHDSRYLEPYGLYITRAQGPRKWDVDGRCYVDYFGGHGALLLGHCHPTVMAAVHAQLDRGTHFGASHEHEIEWAELVKRLIPSAERVRFTSSGTEATLMAVRLARAFSGKQKLIRFNYHFHGWHDHMTSGHNSHFDGTPTTGVLDAVAGNVLLCDQNDEAGLARLLEQHEGEIAAAIIEPTGANGGRLPIDQNFLHALRRLTAEHGVLLIFDEVVTGFRVSRGGAQAAFGVKPDLTTLAKILAGGLPGGAVTGRKDILDLLDFEITKGNGKEKIAHPGTFNANPMSAAAGIATLRIIAESDANEKASAYGTAVRKALNEVFEEEHVPWAAYGTFASVEIFSNPEGIDITPTAFDPVGLPAKHLKGVKNASLIHKLRLGMMLNGVDFNSHPGGVISCTHGESELTDTANAVRNTVRMLKAEGEI
jgi:glutamate-1-semialdehyde 2,1-aminomutase